MDLDSFIIRNPYALFSDVPTNGRAASGDPCLADSRSSAARGASQVQSLYRNSEICRTLQPFSIRRVCSHTWSCSRPNPECSISFHEEWFRCQTIATFLE